MSKPPFPSSHSIHISTHSSLILKRWRGHAHSAPGTLSSQSTNHYSGLPSVTSSVTRPYINPTAGPSNAQRYDSFAPARNPTLPMTTPHANAPAAVPRPCMSTFPPFETIRVSDLYYIAIQFKPSPFFRVDQAVSSIAEFPGMRSQSTVVYIP